MNQRVLSPVVAPSASAMAAAPYMETLSGGTLGVLLNGKEYSDVVLRHVAARLEQRFDLAGVVWWDKGFPAKPAPFLDEIAAGSTFVLNGVGH